MVKVNESTRINWKYEGETTTCTIFDVVTRSIVKQASVKKYKNDAFDKNKARMASLAKVLQTTPRHERLAYWEAYRTSTTKPRW